MGVGRNALGSSYSKDQGQGTRHWHLKVAFPYGRLKLHFCKIHSEFQGWPSSICVLKRNAELRSIGLREQLLATRTTPLSHCPPRTVCPTLGHQLRQRSLLEMHSNFVGEKTHEAHVLFRAFQLILFLLESKCRMPNRGWGPIQVSLF